MNEQTPTSSVPTWFKYTSISLLIWNLFGLGVFGLSMWMYGDEELLEKFGMNEEQIEFINQTPLWVKVAFGVAVIFGTLGCLALVKNKKIAVPMLILSLLGVIAQNVYLCFLSNSIEVMGYGATPFVVPVAIALVPFSIFAANKGWLK